MSWDNATTALRLLSLDPGLGGITIRARSGPVRDTLLSHVPFTNITRLHPSMPDETLLGGLDLSATLSGGHMVQKQGLLQGNRPLFLSMAERTPARMAAHLALHLDAGKGPLILLDEGAEPDELPPPALTERLAFHVDLTDVSMADARWDAMTIGKTTVTHAPEQLAQIVTVAAQCGIDSLRAPAFALRAAKAHAALMGRNFVSDEDIQTACTLTLAHRATQIPEESPQEEAPPPENQDTSENTDTDQLPDIPQDMILDAIRALLPDDLLARVAASKARTGKGNGTGAARKGNRKGRPLPSRAGKRDDARIDLVATLRAAAPWQTIRKRDTGRDGIHVRASDLRIKRFEERSDRLLIFTVDASGSAALARLAEAKGAIEMLLAQAYARRDHVSLISFRGTEAETLLPPTRSLVQTKRRLASLPGGGGTPLATGMAAALEQALLARRKGMTPTICILTDGRANVARDGTGNRVQAAEDAQDMARAIRAQGVDALVIDTGNRPERRLKELSATLAAPYVPLPRADAAKLSTTVAAALGD